MPDTNILETTFHVLGGAAVLRDLMPVASEEDKRAEPTPDHQVLRELEGLEGELELEVLYEPRAEYGRLGPKLVDRGTFGLWSVAGPAALILRSEVPMQVSSNGSTARGVARLRAGDRKYLSFTYSEEAPGVIAPLGRLAHSKVERSTRWWRDWTARCTYHGPYRDAVVRSALALKLMAYAPSGAIIAARPPRCPNSSAVSATGITATAGCASLVHGAGAVCAGI